MTGEYGLACEGPVPSLLASRLRAYQPAIADCEQSRSRCHGRLETMPWPAHGGEAGGDMG